MLEERRTILVVDDDRAVRDVVRRVLEHHGYVVAVSEGGRHALDLLGRAELRESLALVILDVSMPGMSGPTALIELQALLPQVPIVYFSGQTVDVPRGADAFIEKPVSMDGFVHAIRDILDRPLQRPAS